MALPAGALTPAHLTAMSRAFAADRTAKLAQNAVTVTTIDDIALDRSVVTAIDTSVSDKVDTWPVANQKKSGRCWLFAGLNSFKQPFYRDLGMKEFEFSQAWLLFWDKLEKSNYLLTAMIELADHDLDDRTVHHLLTHPTEDGGQWNMFVALVTKYGVVPKFAMPETESSSNTRPMNTTLGTLLRRAARDVRTAALKQGEAAALAVKDEAMAQVYRLLSIHLGTPPTEFLWQYRDKDGVFHREGVMTPRQFADTYLPADLADYICVVNDPRPSSPYGRTFTVDHLGNVVGAAPVVYLNAEIDVLRRAVIETIQDGTPVWFGCDTGKQSSRKLGIWDAHLFDYEGVYGVDMSMTKAEALQYGEAMMTHAMVFTGVDLVDGAPRRWRVENSWGEEPGEKGFFTMNDSWFDDHVFEVAVHRSRLPQELVAQLGTEPIVLPAWDPMGALA